jgi:branched-chain amino acid transport system ATP-binding protein
MLKTAAANKMMLSLESVDAYHGKARILFGMTLEVGPGEAVALLGRNGAGKTTTLKSIIGITRPRAGTVTLAGVPIHGMRPFRISALGLGYVPEDRRIFTRLSVLENLEVGRRPHRAGYRPWTPERLFGLFPNLAELRHRPGGTLSGGEQQMLTISRTLMGNPVMILLDEPSEGLAPVIVDQLVTAILQLKQEGVSILLAEQNLYFSRRVCERAYIVHQGRVSHEGTMAALDDKTYERHCAF